MDPSSLALDQVADRCREETERYRRSEPHDDRFCFDLIRRAICGRCQAAWSAFLSQYRGIVLAWIRRHPISSTVSEDDDYWVNRTFERFWRAVDADHYARFWGLPAVLRYLKMCAHSALMDEVRAREAAAVAADPAEVESATTEEIEDRALAHQSRRELWAAISRTLHDEDERLLVYLSFVLDYKPGEITAQHPDRFKDVADVYRVKRNVLDRLRRSREVMAFLE